MHEPVDRQPASPLVLIADDDITIRCLARASLEANGFDVQEAGDGLEALQAFAANKPDVVLLDVLMPNLDGFGTYQRIRGLPFGAETPIVMLTGLDDLKAVQKAYEIGVTDFITKPFNPLVMSHRIHYILRANRAFKRLRRSEAALERAQHMANLGSLEWDPTADSVRASAEALRIMGMEETEGGLRLQHVLDRVHPEDVGNVRRAMEATAREKGPVSLDYRMRLPNGTERYVHQESALEEASSGNAPCVVATIQDISKLKLAEKQIQRLAYYDSLTGLPNGLLFRDRLDQALARALRMKESLAVLFLDLDRFKRINDTLGHSAGDDLLKATAERLLSILRSTDSISHLKPDPGMEQPTFGRLGGDEFTLLLTNIRYVQVVAKVARRILDALEQPLSLNGQEIIVTASIGIAMFPEDGADAESLLKNADAAMYQAKNQGRNTFRFFSRIENQTAFEKLSLENDLYQAIKRKEFVVHYQPRALVSMQRIVGAEALVRWRHPKVGCIGPEMFLHVAEEAGILGSIDGLVMNEACRQCKIWQAGKNQPLVLSVNVSGQSFWRNEFAASVKGVLRATRLDPAYLELELTEGIVMANVEAAIRKLRELKAFGVNITIDDFGTGYSSLGHLKDLPLDCLKIDRSFVKDIGNSQQAEAIVKAILALARSLKLRVVAEGVETNLQVAFLQREGCTEIQGYLLSKPMAPEYLEEILFPARQSQNPSADPAAQRTDAVADEEKASPSR